VQTPTKTPANRRESNVWQSPKTGRWHWEVRFTRRDGTKFRKAGSYKTEKEARSARDDAYLEFNKNEGKGVRETVKSWCDHCLTSVFPNEHEENSTSVYRYVLEKHAYDLIGSIPLLELSPTQLQLFFNELRVTASESVTIKVRTALSSCLTRAVLTGLISSNPARFVRIRQTPKTALIEADYDDDDDDNLADKRILTSEEQAALLKAARGKQIEPVIWLGLKLGLRLGECLGLAWSSVNLEKRTVRIKQQLKRIPDRKGLQIRPPKTKAGYRTLNISNALYEFLRASKERAEANGVEWVCPNRDGGLYDPRNAGRHFTVAANKAVVGEKPDGSSILINGQKGKPDVTHHDCRSTLLSYLANHANDGVGVRPAMLKGIAGHSKIDTTMRYYVRATDEDVLTAMKAIP